ncbi:MAG: cysteine desulfurase-like protein [Acidobacteriota bacterium]
MTADLDSVDLDRGPNLDLEQDLDLDAVRAQFPALSSDWAFFDNAGGSLPTRGVVEAARRHMERFPVQLGASYRVSQEAAERVEDGRRAVAAWIHADPGEIILSASTTANVSLLARAISASWPAGSEVVMTDLDHEANAAPWRRLGDGAGDIRVKAWRPRESGRLELEDLEALLTERTRLVAVTHCSNLIGEIVDVPAIARLAHAAGSLLCVDGVAYAPHARVDVRSLGADFYVFSAYKTYGPHVGVMWGRRHLLEDLAGQNHPFITALPSKLEPGGTNYELVSALPAIVDYLASLGDPAAADPGGGDLSARLDRAFARISRHEEALQTRLLDFLNGRRGVRVHGPSTGDRARRVPTISFSLEGQRSQDLPPGLDAQKIAVRWGHFYAPNAVRALGLSADDGVVRVSMVHYNTLEEVDRLIAALDPLLP